MKGRERKIKKKKLKQRRKLHDILERGKEEGK